MVLGNPQANYELRGKSRIDLNRHASWMTHLLWVSININTQIQQLAKLSNSWTEGAGKPQSWSTHSLCYELWNRWRGYWEPGMRWKDAAFNLYYKMFTDRLILYVEMSPFTSAGPQRIWAMIPECICVFASMCLCICLLVSMCPWGMNVFADMHLLMFIHTHTHAHSRFGCF